MGHNKTVKKHKPPTTTHPLHFAELPPSHSGSQSSSPPPSPSTSPSPSICIIIPHRNRHDQLKTFLALFKNSPTTDIYVIDQNNADKFNRGLLLNIGFHIASHTNGRTYDRYIFHDVDSYPDATLKRQYGIDPQKYPVVHYASPHLGYKYHYDNFFGGVVAFDRASFERINGFPNTIFGWGGEDDIIARRVAHHKYTVFRPVKGGYELPEHDRPTPFEVSFKNNGDKHKKIAEDADKWMKDGVRQIPMFFITVVQSANWRDFIAHYDTSNIHLNYSPLADVTTFPLIPSTGETTRNVFYYKIDYLAQHIVTPAKSASYLLHRNYPTDERNKRLAKFDGIPIFHNGDKKSPYYNHIEPLLYWGEIEKRILDTFTEPKLTPKTRVKGQRDDAVGTLVERNFEKYATMNGNSRVSKMDLKNTLRYVFGTFNEFIYYRIRGGKVTHKFYVFNIDAPEVDWYEHLNWGRTHPVKGGMATHVADHIATHIKKMQKFIAESNNVYYMTLAKPTFLRANGCLLGVESTDYVRELNTSYVAEFTEMMEYACKTREMADSDIIVNRKDFAYFNTDNTYAYNHLLKNVSIPSPPRKWFPVCSQSVHPTRNLDIVVPTADEWTTIRTHTSTSTPLTNGNTKWEKRYDTAFFRGSSTGCGTTIQSNPRLKMAHISKKWETLKGHKNMIDIGVSKLTSRLKAFEGTADYIDKREHTRLLGKFTDTAEQTKYKYIFNIMGNGQAYRFSTEFFKGAVILNVANSETPQMWFEPLLENGVNYVSVRDVKNLEAQEDILYKAVTWLNENDEDAEEIAENGRQFAKQYINRETIADYWCSVAYHINRMMVR